VDEVRVNKITSFSSLSLRVKRTFFYPEHILAIYLSVLTQTLSKAASPDKMIFEIRPLIGYIQLK